MQREERKNDKRFPAKSIEENIGLLALEVMRIRKAIEEIVKILEVKNNGRRDRNLPTGLA